MIKSLFHAFSKPDKMLRRPDFQPNHSYAQDGEDMILRSLFADTISDFWNYKGFYIDVGAHHPFRFSNTMHFYEKGWHGINIEPTPMAMELFEKYRKRDINLNIGIGRQQGMLTFYCFNEPALNSFDKALSESRDQEDSPYHIVKTVDIEIHPLEDVLNRYVPDNTVIDFMSIDVEGLDLQVLQSNNWEKFRPRLILTEDMGTPFSNLFQSPVHSFLTDKGYELIGKTPRTLIYKTEGLA